VPLNCQWVRTHIKATTSHLNNHTERHPEAMVDNRGGNVIRLMNSWDIESLLSLRFEDFDFYLDE